MVRSVGEAVAAPNGTRLGGRLIFFLWVGCSSVRRQMFLGGKGGNPYSWGRRNIDVNRGVYFGDFRPAPFRTGKDSSLSINPVAGLIGQGNVRGRCLRTRFNR